MNTETIKIIGRFVSALILSLGVLFVVCETIFFSCERFLSAFFTSEEPVIGLLLIFASITFLVLVTGISDRGV